MREIQPLLDNAWEHAKKLGNYVIENASYYVAVATTPCLALALLHAYTGEQKRLVVDNPWDRVICADDLVQAMPPEIHNPVRAVLMTDDAAIVGLGANNEPGSVFAVRPDGWKQCLEDAHSPYGLVNALAKGPDGSTWVVTDGSGVFHTVGRENTWGHETGKTGLNDERGYAAGFMDGGSPIVGLLTGVDRRIEGEWFHTPGMATHAILTSSEGDLWLGGVDGGINRQTKTGTIHYGAETLGSGAVRGILEGKDGRIVVGTDGGGVDIYSPDTNSWTKLDGYPEGKVYGIGIDSRERVWAVGPNGTYYWNGEEAIQYDPQASLSIAFGCEGCAWSPDNVLVGTGSGILLGRFP